MDLDLAQVRAFTVTAEELHFGRAAEQLAISQQALSKRIARLEAAFGARLLDRDGRGVVGVTEAGRRFLEPARRLLADGDLAVAAVLGAGRPLRIDVWGHLYAPMRTVAQAVAQAAEEMPHLVPRQATFAPSRRPARTLAAPAESPSTSSTRTSGRHAESTHRTPLLDGQRLPDAALEVETGSGRDLPSVAAALLRGETDAGFGRVHPLPDQRDAGLTHRLVRLEPVDALVSADHPLAEATALRAAELRDSVLWYPAAVDRLDFLTRFADHFGITRRAGGANLGLEHFVARVRADPQCFSLFPADSPLPELPGIRSIPLVDPTPLYAWSLLWRSADRHPSLEPLLRAFTAAARSSRWLDYDPGRDWLPDVDHAAMPS